MNGFTNEKYYVIRQFFNYSSKNVYVQYTIAFMIIFILGFSGFIFNNKTFIWNIDGNWISYPALHWFGRFFREIFYNFREGLFVIPLFDFRIGLGEDIFRPMITPSRGLDLLDMLSIFVPSKHTETLFNIIATLRYYLSGIAFLHFCKYLHFKNFSCLVGTLAYVFNAWTFYSIRHPEFLVATIFIPLAIEGLDRVLIGKKPYMLIVTLFLFLLTGFYFPYMTFLFFIPYTLIRIHHLYPKQYVKNLIKLVSYSLLLCVITIMMASFYLVPLISAFLEDGGSSRLGNINIDSLWRYNLSEYREFFVRIIANPVPSWDNLTMPAIFIISFFALFAEKKEESNFFISKGHLLFLFLLLLIVRLIPFGGWVMSGFSYISNRWTFLLVFVSALIIVKNMTSILNLNDKLLFLSSLSASIYGFCIFFTAQTHNVYFLVPFFILIANIILLRVKTEEKISYKKLSVLVLLSLNISLSMHFMYHHDFSNFSGSFSARGSLNNIYSDLPQQIKPSDGDEIYRIDDINALPIAPVVGDYFGISSYYNEQNPNFTRFISYIENSEHTSSFRVNGFDDRSILNALMSIRYVVANNSNLNRIPFGYTKYFEEGGRTIFKNDYEIPFGFTYQASISEETYLQLNPVAKQELLLNYVVLENSMNDTLPTFATLEIPYQIISTENLEWKNGKMSAWNDARITLGFEGLPNSETYIRLTGITGDGTTTSLTVIGENMRKNRIIALWRNGLYSPAHHHNHTINLGFSKEPQTEVTIEINRNIQTLDNIEIFSFPLDNFPKQVEVLSTEHMSNINMHTRSNGIQGLTNRITGEITTSGSRYLFLSIPYSTGWRAYVNDVPAQISRANIAFMAIELEEGHHKIELKYTPPGLYLGLFLSTLGFIGFFVLIKVRRVLLARGIQIENHKE